MHNVQDDKGKLFVCLFVFLGIGFISSALGIVGGFIMDYQDELALSLLQASLSGTEEQEGNETDVEQVPAWLPECCHDIWTSPAFWRLMNDLSVVSFFVFFGTIFFQYQEQEADGSDINFLDAFYLSVMSVTTVGFGDYSPRSEEGRLVCVFWILFSVVAVSKAAPLFRLI